MLSKIFCCATEQNLANMQSYVTRKYRELELQGSNQILDSIQRVKTNHKIQEYDAMIFFQQTFHQQDLEQKGALTEALNLACVYAIKDLPVYFVVKDGNKDLLNHLKANIQHPNVRYYQYSSLDMSVLEGIIKEVLVHSNHPEKIEVTAKSDMQAYREAVKAKKVSSQIDRALSIRQNRHSGDLAKLSMIEMMVQQYATTNAPSIDLTEVLDKGTLLDNIKETIFDKNQKGTATLGIRSFDEAAMKSVLSPESIRRDIQKTDPDYVSMEIYLKRLQEAINAIEDSNEPDKHNKVLQLMEEKANAGSQMDEMLLSFTSKLIKSSVQHLAEKSKEDLESLREFGDRLSSMDLLEKDASTVEELKSKRKVLIQEIYVMIKQFNSTVLIVQGTLQQFGDNVTKQYALEAKAISEYSAAHNLDIRTVAIPNAGQVTKKLVELFNEVRDTANGALSEAQVIFNRVGELVQTDTKIIDTQTRMIDTMSTQKVQKILVVDNVLKTKLSTIVGPNNAGKTFTALNMALYYRANKKVLLVDLNLPSPSLRYYNNNADPTVNQSNYFNQFTITFEEFLKLNIESDTLYSQIAYHDNLSIIQPASLIDLKKTASYFNPNSFDLYVKKFLDKMALFFDEIIVILPESLFELDEILSSTGSAYIVCDFNPMNMDKVKDLRKDYGHLLDKTPKRHFVINKYHRGVGIDLTLYLSACHIDSIAYKLLQVNEASSAVSDKITGKFPYESSPTVKKTFDDLFKRV